MLQKFRKNLKCVLSSCLILVCAVAFVPMFASTPTTSYACFAKTEEGNLEVHFIDVGQGDSIFIELPDRRTMLIDAGETSKGDTVVNYIKNVGYTKIDYLVLTHSDSDHSGGMVKVFENFEIATIFRPFAIATNTTILTENEDLYPMLSSEEVIEVSTQVYAKFIKYAYSETFNSVPSKVIVSYDGYSILSSNSSYPYVLQFHNPPKSSNEAINTGKTTGYPTKKYGGSEANQRNSLSAIIGLEYSNRKYLFTGDTTFDGEEDFLANLSAIEKQSVTNIDLLKVAHHGSDTSSCNDFITLTTPSYAVISVGAGNSYGHPCESTINALNRLWPDAQTNKRILRTDLDGNILCVEDSAGSMSLNNIVSEETTPDTSLPNYITYIIIAGVILLFIIIILVTIYSKKDLKKVSKSDALKVRKTARKIIKVMKK